MSHFTEIQYWHTANPKKDNGAAKDVPLPLPFDEGIQTLRMRLKTLNAWPEAGDTFVSLLTQVRGYGVTLVPTDYDWLAQVAKDAANGEDIGLRYPSIFQKLLTFPDLRQKFLHTLQFQSADA